MTSCHACDATLTAHETSAGWCDGCGKKLPESIRHAVRKALDQPGQTRKRAVKEKSDSPLPGVLWGVLGVFALILLVALMVESPAFAIRLFSRVFAVVMIAGVAGLFRLVFRRS
jgi:hypothetical protein